MWPRPGARLPGSASWRSPAIARCALLGGGCAVRPVGRVLRTLSALRRSGLPCHVGPLPPCEDCSNGPPRPRHALGALPCIPPTAWRSTAHGCSVRPAGITRLRATAPLGRASLWSTARAALRRLRLATSVIFSEVGHHWRRRRKGGHRRGGEGRRRGSRGPTGASFSAVLRFIRCTLDCGLCSCAFACDLPPSPPRARDCGLCSLHSHRIRMGGCAMNRGV